MHRALHKFILDSGSPTIVYFWLSASERLGGSEGLELGSGVQLLILAGHNVTSSPNSSSGASASLSVNVWELESGGGGGSEHPVCVWDLQGELPSPPGRL